MRLCGIGGLELGVLISGAEFKEAMELYEALKEKEPTNMVCEWMDGCGCVWSERKEVMGGCSW